MPERPTFFEHEIRSKVWTAQDGSAVGLIDWTVIKSLHHGEVLVVKFGETNMNTVNCLEFYAVQRRDSPTSSERYLLVDHDYGPQSKYTWENSNVVAFNYFDSKEKMVFGIKREIRTEGTDRRKLIHYALDYNFRGDFRMEANMSQWETEAQ
jgi:hypothetical protein